MATVSSDPSTIKPFSIVVACTSVHRGIGDRGSMPWDIPVDLNRFRLLTTYTPRANKVNAVVMGRRTWESIPERHRPLPRRYNIVVSSSQRFIDHVNKYKQAEGVTSVERALERATRNRSVDQVFVIGGASVYEQCIHMAACTKIHMTSIFKEFDCDTFFPCIDPAAYKETMVGPLMKQNGLHFRFSEFTRANPEDTAATTTTPPAIGETKTAIITPPVVPANAMDTADTLDTRGTTGHPNLEEQQYLDLVRDVIETGTLRDDRTGTGTLSKFGCSMRFSLRDGRLPLLTTKRVFWRGIAEELLWFINGDTNANTLTGKGIKIWDANGSREFLDSRGLTDREVGDLGPVYGFQWRHFGARYVDCHTDYKGQGVDQLAQVIETIKTDPHNRRIIMSAWNPSDLKLMALPPCHMFCQFYVAGGELSCQMYQRSADLGLGVPFNIASYSLLTCMVAHVCGLQPGEFIHVIGDAHVYKTHVDVLKQQLERVPRPFPTLTLNPEVKDIDSFQFSDLALGDYKPHNSIPMTMAV